MGEEDYKAIIATYQQKSFELFTKNIVLETQVGTLRNQVEQLNVELEKLKSSKTRKKVEEEFQ
jgi:dynactin complex subunit